jgi:D,D-heptose 1,7-bisphosphate phosphatase
MKNALFLDRDGVINIDKGYVYRFEDIEWCEGIFDIIKLANERNYLVIVLTNQSGIAKGMYQIKDVLELHEKMDKFLKSKNLFIDDWLFCPEDDGYRRKPSPGMMVEAHKKHDIDLSRSYMIGDKPSDVLNIEGPKTFLIEGRYNLESVVVNQTVKVYKDLFEILEVLKVEFN